MIVEEKEYKGRPILILKKDENEKYPFSFGLTKAKSIIECYDDIQKFVSDHDATEN